MENNNPGGDLSAYFPSLKEILEKGKGCEWRKPDRSFCCGAVYWWHGWRERWWDNQRVWVRRLICSSCKKGTTIGPGELWRRFQASASRITQACEERIGHQRWVSGYSHSRIRWWVRVARKLLALFGDLVSGIRQMLSRFPLRAPLSRFWLAHQPVP